MADRKTSSARPGVAIRANQIFQDNAFRVLRFRKPERPREAGFPSGIERPLLVATARRARPSPGPGSKARRGALSA